MNLNENKDLFLAEVQKLHHRLDDLIKEYGVEDSVISIMMTGLVDLDNEEDPVVKAIYSYSLETKESLMEVMEFLADVYDESDGKGYNLDDMLGDAGISLN